MPNTPNIHTPGGNGISNDTLTVSVSDGTKPLVSALVTVTSKHNSGSKRTDSKGIAVFGTPKVSPAHADAKATPESKVGLHTQNIPHTGHGNERTTSAGAIQFVVKDNLSQQPKIGLAIESRKSPNDQPEVLLTDAFGAVEFTYTIEDPGYTVQITVTNPLNQSSVVYSFPLSSTSGTISQTCLL